jgi:hypothetical protein
MKPNKATKPTIAVEISFFLSFCFYMGFFFFFLHGYPGQLARTTTNPTNTLQTQ